MHINRVPKFMGDTAFLMNLKVCIACESKLVTAFFTIRNVQKCHVWVATYCSTPPQSQIWPSREGGR